MGCVFQDLEPPKSTTILRKSSNILNSIRCVRFTKAVLRHANIRDQNPSLGMICPGDPHQRNPNIPEFEDRSQEETEWQERCAREAAWRLAKNILKLKDLKKPTIVITANREVQTHEEATVHVKELDLFLTMKVLENTPAVLPLGKLCDKHGYPYEWIKGQKTTSH